MAASATKGCRTRVACGVFGVALMLLSACSAFDRGLLAASPDAGGPLDDGGNVEHDAALPPQLDGGTLADAGDAGGADSGADSGPPDQECEANPSPTEECPQICDEVCNGLDDDCDGEIDEGDASLLCTVAHATGLCVEGECLLVECEEHYRDCDHTPTNGCEASLNDVSTCGACNIVCDIERALEGCEDEECVPIGCEPGYDECDNTSDTLCETEVKSAAQCGACDAACDLDHAVPECEALQCVVARCTSGYDDCDQSPGNGCEAPLDTLENCGACDTPCALAACSGGVCSAIACTAPDADCDADGVDCEIDLAIDVNNCGACNSPCTLAAGAVHASDVACADLQCEPICDVDYGDCDPDYQNGCETPITTVQNCGDCGRSCDALLANTATTACATGGVCEIATCDSGYEDCDGMDATGCEVNVHSVTDCGGCSSTADNELCTGLADVTTSSCGNGSCAIDTCAAGYANCDGISANGCERDTAANGPCLPDTNCTKYAYGGNDYYFCTNDSSWTSARDKCRVQTRGHLVHIDDMAEDAFVQSHRVANAWIGASDLGIEGLWRWSNDGMPFWRGGVSGAAQLAQYTRWSGGQPDDYQAAEDCAELYADGTWNDLACTSLRDFVCEETPDLCASDTTKIDPGQCGCGIADTDTDNDGFATCNDACPSDVSKIAPGVCNCGVADTNTDGDAQLDCNETCDSDPSKLAPGVCGCGVSDVDTDGDGTPDCNDGCPVNASSTSSATGCGLGYVPRNIDATRLNPNLADATTTFNCAAVLNTSGTPSFTTWCGGALPQITVLTQTSGPEIAVVALRGLSIPSGGSLHIVGTRAAALVVFGSASIVGTLDANASGTTAGGGGNWSCGTSQGANGSGNTARLAGASGGGGGGFGTAGGRSGVADTDDNDIAAANGGVARGTTTLIPLLSGCAGGQGGDCSTAGAAGGGAIQLTVASTLTVSGTISANGGNGATPCGASDEGGGTGGGSGGAITLEATTLTTSGSTIQARGGNGGANGAYDGIYSCGGSSGGSGSTAVGTAGGNAISCQGGSPGGGGGYGRIVQCNRSNNAGC